MLRSLLQDGTEASFVDAAEYKKQDAFSAVVVNAQCHMVSFAAVQTFNPEEDEEVTIALAMLDVRRETVYSDSKAAIRACQSHRYLGPGNPLRNGDPVDEDDGIAKSHDEAYERAKSHVDVFAADQASAALFLNDFRRTGNWHSALGAVGLGTKNIVEQYVLGRSLYGMPGDRRKTCT
ncbi:hypothetical protein MTO96_039012 [Rhipicephalus appendiculatus]